MHGRVLRADLWVSSGPQTLRITLRISELEL